MLTLKVEKNDSFIEAFQISLEILNRTVNHKDVIINDLTRIERVNNIIEEQNTTKQMVKITMDTMTIIFEGLNKLSKRCDELDTKNKILEDRILFFEKRET